MVFPCNRKVNKTWVNDLQHYKPSQSEVTIHKIWKPGALNTTCKQPYSFHGFSGCLSIFSDLPLILLVCFSSYKDFLCNPPCLSWLWEDSFNVSIKVHWLSDFFWKFYILRLRNFPVGGYVLLPLEYPVSWWDSLTWGSFHLGRNCYTKVKLLINVLPNIVHRKLPTLC